MPRSLKVVVSCDYCSGSIEGEDHEGALTLTINKKGPRQVDLCEDCMSNLSPLTLLSVFEGADDLPEPKPARRGRRADGEGMVYCPDPTCNAASPTAQGLGRHTRAAHNKTVSELRGEWSAP